MAQQEHEPQRRTPVSYDPSIMTPVQRLTRDLAQSARVIGDTQVRFLVDAYYQMQGARIRAKGQVTSMENNPLEMEDEETGEIVDVVEPHDVLSWLAQQNATLEKQVQRALVAYVNNHPVGEWLTSVTGIGHVIAAGMLAHINIDQAPTVGHIWRFAGLDPTVKWEKKTKRPWNAALKVLCWKAGESFVKFHKLESCFYGHVWLKQKAIYIERNDSGVYKERAAKILTERKIRKETEAYGHYSAGHLPPAHIHAMARRYAVKLFLSHLHEEMYRRLLGQEPPFPYAIAQLGHVHKIDAPAPKSTAKKSASKKGNGKKKK